MAMSVHFSSESNDWATPQKLFDDLNTEFGPFDLDVCAEAWNAKCTRFFSPSDDGLLQPWSGRCWMNPPYGRQIGRWIEKAYREAGNGCTVVCLIPARTDTSYWHTYVMKADVIRFLRGRIYFVQRERERERERERTSRTVPKRDRRLWIAPHSRVAL